MKRWKCHKEVEAAKIVAIMNPVLVADDGSTTPMLTCLILDNDASRPMSDEWIEKHKPQVGGYYVQYDDGYESFSPAEAFENGYTVISGTL